MPKVSEKTATQGGEFGPVTEHSDVLDGYTVGFCTWHVDMDERPMLKGLPNDECSCPHWGYVLKGRFTYQVGGREEVIEAGDAFYLPPGHAGVGKEPGSEMIMFSPTAELQKVEEVVMANFAAANAD